MTGKIRWTERKTHNHILLSGLANPLTQKKKEHPNLIIKERGKSRLYHNDAVHGLSAQHFLQLFKMRRKRGFIQFDPFVDGVDAQPARLRLSLSFHSIKLA